MSSLLDDVQRRTLSGHQLDLTHGLVDEHLQPADRACPGVLGGDTESLGRRTSQSVVSAIFAVILADALFSIFFARVGW